MAKRPDDPSDPRVVRTRRILHEAVLALATERDLDTLSIADVAERAQVNRATFYAHYRSLDELLDVALQLELESLISAVTTVDDVIQQAQADGTPPQILTTVQTLDRRHAVYRRVFGPNGSAKVVHGFRQRIAEVVERHLRDGSLKLVRPLPIPVAAHAVAGSVLGVLVHWLSAKPKVSSARAAEWLWSLFKDMAPQPAPVEKTKSRARK